MIDSTLQQELRAKYNPDGSKLREAQMAILEILKYVDGLCRKHNLCYWLSSGTLLGAIRHGGFIPWDDDIDIEMPLKDYRKLRKIMIRDKESQYAWQDHSTDKDYWLRFTKVRKSIDPSDNKQRNDREIYDGLYIDIFPVERMVSCFSPWSNFVLNQWSYKLTHSRYILVKWLANLRFALGSWVLIPALRGITLLNKHTKYHLSYGIYFCKPRQLTTLYNTIDWLFEGIPFKVPSEYEQYLVGLYGTSYNELPPVELRKVHGNIIDI